MGKKVWHEARLARFCFKILKDKIKYLERGGSFSFIGNDLYATRVWIELE
jgi:hypothetical protein